MSDSTTQKRRPGRPALGPVEDGYTVYGIRLSAADRASLVTIATARGTEPARMMRAWIAAGCPLTVDV